MSGQSNESNERLSATAEIDAPAEAVFAVLTDPTAHPRIDGTGWVEESLDYARLDHVGQIFRMVMFHETTPTRTTAWPTASRSSSWIGRLPGSLGQEQGSGEVEFGGWLWRYDLTPVDQDRTSVSLSYDWSAATSTVRKFIQFPPFDQSHLVNSLDHLAALSTRDEEPS